jgi:RNA-directed DNA polymerase
MNEPGKSDRPIVPGKPANNGGSHLRPAESAEGRGLAKGNLDHQNMPFGHSAVNGMSSAEVRIRHVFI